MLDPLGDTFHDRLGFNSYELRKAGVDGFLTLGRCPQDEAGTTLGANGCMILVLSGRMGRPLSMNTIALFYDYGLGGMDKEINDG